MRVKTVTIIVLACVMGMLPLSSMMAQDGTAADAGYVIGQGDVLHISVWKDESLTREVVVLPDGTITFPLIGSVRAEGRTVSELKNDVSGKIKRYVPNPVLSVSVRSVSSLYIYVTGRVNSPGRFVLNGTVNVLQALAMAGGLNPFANSNGIKIIRTVNGTSSVIRFRYNDVAKGRNLEQNIPLMRGDVVVVP